MPSWWEFVQWLISTEGGRTRGDIDQHWRPYSDFCEVCLIPYNYILHFEHLDDEEEIFMSIIDNNQILKRRHENIHLESSYSRQEILRQYYSLLSKEEIFSLYKIFENDFLMFNYSIDSFLNYNTW